MKQEPRGRDGEIDRMIGEGVRVNYLLATVAWQVKYQHREKGYPHARYYEVDGVEQSLPSHGDVEGDVEVRLVTTRVKLFVSAIRTFARFTHIQRLLFIGCVSCNFLLISTNFELKKEAANSSTLTLYIVEGC